jgi:hypothetical protein
MFATTEDATMVEQRGCTRNGRMTYLTHLGRKRGIGLGRWSAVSLMLLGAVCLMAGTAGADEVTLFEDNFESDLVGNVWDLTGDWRFRTNSPCLPNEVGYLSEDTALVFDYAGECTYRNSRSGFATMRSDVLIPITAPSVSLQWWDFVGAELGHDFYFVQVSTDGGVTWPHEIFRESEDEDFWDEESVDLSGFVGQSIRLRFGFSSDATISNFGWYVDDVRIVGEQLPEGVSALAVQDAKFKEGLTINDVDPSDPNPPVVEFTIVVDPPNATPITVNHYTQDGTAASGLDFVASSGLLTIPVNTTTFTIPFTIVDDTFFENTEDFALVLDSASSNANISIGMATGLIADNELLTPLYKEDFEGNQPGQFKFDPALLLVNTPVDGWQVLEDSQCIAPALGYASENKALVFNNGDPNCTYYTPGGVEGIVSTLQPITISGEDALSAQLRFWRYVEISFDTDSIESIPTQVFVEASKNGGVPGSWQILKTYGPTEPSADPYVLDWAEEVIDLKGFLANDPPLDPLDPMTFNVFNNEDVFVRFRFVQPAEDNPNTAAGVYIDDIIIGVADRPSGVSKLSIQAPWAPTTPALPDYEPKATTEGNLGTTLLSFPIRFKPLNAESITIAYATEQIETTVDNTRGTTTTKERTIRRLASVCNGDSDGFDDPTDITDQWEGFPQNTFDGLGSHTTNCTAAEIDDMFFSEYVEGSASNKAIEIYNGTGSPLNLDEYTVELYPNGSQRPSDTLQLDAIKPVLANNDTVVIANSGADAAVLALADITDKVTAFNGNDALVLLHNGTIIDMIGVVGSDPGSEWGIGKVRHAATADVDYVSTEGTITIPAGTDPDITPVAIDVLMVGDDQPEPAEEFFKLKLDYVTQNVYLVDEEVLGVIYDDDVPSTFDIFVRGNPGVREVSEGVGSVTFTVQINPPRTVPIGVRYKTSDGTALAGPGLDYVASEGIITFPANTSTQNVTVTILNDDKWEDADDTTVGVSDPEHFFIQLTTESPYAEGGKPVQININDDDPFTALPQINISDAAVTEGSCATISAEEPCNEIDPSQPLYEATFKVTIAPAATELVVLDWSTFDGTAVSGIDFESNDGQVVFQIGDTEQEITVRSYADRGVEGDETFNVVLSNPQGDVDVKRNTGIGTIRDDDYTAMTFGVNGSFVTRRDLSDEVPSEDLLEAGASADLTAAEFMSFNYDTLFGWEADILYKVNLTTGLLSTIADRSGDVNTGAGETWSALAWDHTNGVAWAATTAGNIFKIDLEDGTLAGPAVVTIPAYVVAIAIHPTSGRIYAVSTDGTTAVLHEVEGTAITTVGQIQGLTPGPDRTLDKFWDCDFNDATGALYLNANEASGGWIMRTVNITDASSTVVFSNPPATSLALASPPPPATVQWTNDLYFASRGPSGTSVVPDDSVWPNSDAGVDVSGLGDVNGDAYEDVAIAAPDAFGGAGAIFVLFGSPDTTESVISEIVTTFYNNEFTFDSSFLDGDRGLLIRGATDVTEFGRSVSGLDDMNNDGIAEFAIGHNTSNGAGGVFVVFGNRQLPSSFQTSDIGATLQGKTVAGVKIPGVSPGDNLGFAVSGAGDINGDSLNDLIIGAPDAATTGNGRAGAVYVIFGASSGIGANGIVNLAALTRQRGVTFYGEKDNDDFGYSVSGAGDVNGDGIDDFVTGAPLADFRLATPAAPATAPSVDEGAVMLLYGHRDYGTDDGPLTVELKKLSNAIYDGGGGVIAPNKLAFTSTLPNEGALDVTINPENDLLNSLTGGLPGFRLRGQGGGLGKVVQSIGDWNGNGIDDLIAGAPDPVSPGEPGRAYLLLGDEGQGAQFSVVDVGTAIRGATLVGIEAVDGFGSVAGGAGDYNGDGLMDALFGAPGATPGGFSGEVYVLWGRETATDEKLGTISMRDLADDVNGAAQGRYLYNTQGGDDYDFGRALASAGDFNNDNVTDVIIGRDGGAFLLYGEAAGVMATFTNRMQSGETDLPNLGGAGGISTGLTIYSGVGQIGSRDFSAPASRVKMRFTGGGTGGEGKDVSTQSVTLIREAAPDVVVGSGDADDDAWVPGGVHWQVQTDRQGFTESEIEFYYRPEEVVGLDLDRVGIFRAKESVDSLGEFTTWFWLPFTHDPDRKVFTVTRSHTLPTPVNTPTPQEEFNGTYALVQADLLTLLGEEIRPVGVTRDQVFENGPEFTTDMAFWHKKEKKLYATKAGTITVRWKNKEGQEVSVIQGQNMWPDDSTGRYQPFIAGSPSVNLSNTGSIIEFFNVELESTDNSNATISIDSNKNFSATLPTGATQTARALIRLSDDANPDRGNVYFQFLRVVQPENPAYLVGGTAGVPWNIGQYIGAATDSAYNLNHNDACGSPYLLYDNVPYARSSVRYPGFYDRTSRTGTIVPVNVKKSTDADMILTFYQTGAKLIDAKTGNQIRDPRSLQPLPVFCWPHISRKYVPQWAPDSQVDKIIISQQNGTGDLDAAVYGTEIDIYVQNNAAQPGFNPNEEHALIAPYGAGVAVFALRNDLNGSESQPYVLLVYRDPNDVTAEGTNRMKMKPYKVIAQTPAFPFGDWPGVTGLDDPFEGEAGAFILPPYPLSFLRPSPDNKFTSGPVWKDRNNSLWAIAATGPTASEKIGMHFYYPVLEDFYFPAAYKTAYSGNRTFTGTNPDDVPWLDGGIALSSPALPVKVTYVTDWPAVTPEFQLGDILINAKKGLPTINGQCSVNVLYQESTDVTKTSTPKPSVGLIDPVATRGVHLEEVPTDISTAMQGQNMIFTDLPPALQFRITWNENTELLTMKGIFIEPTAGDDYVLLNVLTNTDEQRLRDLSSNPDWQDAIDALANDDTGAGSIIQIAERGYVTKLASDITSSATSITVTTGTGSKAPAVPFLLELRDRYDLIKNEVVRVTAKSGDTFTIVRGQEDTTAKAFKANDTAQNWNPDDAPVTPPEVTALSTGNAQGTGYVTLAFGGQQYCDPLPVSLEIIRVVDDIVPGGIAVVTPGCVFEEKLTLMQTNAFNGKPEEFYFEWLYLPPSLSPKPFPDGPDLADPTDPWRPPPLATAAGAGLSEITISGPGLLTLTDNWFAVRYKKADNTQPWGSRWSDWTPIQLAPGWLKRVVGEINPFTQRATGGGIEGAESAFASFGVEAPNRIVSMISQAGPRWEGAVPLTCDGIDDFGLIPIYQTVLGRGADLSINALSPVDNPDVNTALLLVASRVNDLYTLIGNEAYADAQDPTIGFGTDDGTYGSEATSIHSFMNQVPSLLEEELALLRGRDDRLAPSIETRPYYNRLVWNFSNDMTGGEVAYALNYNIRDEAEGNGAGSISADDAKRLYPQGHGDAWGHYLTALTTYYKLMIHPFYTWVPRSETILVGGQPLTVDYLDERKFAKTAAAKARAGAEIVNLSYRELYTENPQDQYLGYKDEDTDRAWGFSEWASRAGQGAFIDWAVGNAVIRANDPNPNNEGIAKVDRTTVPELVEIANAYMDIQTQVDNADLGLNPLGLGTNVIPFDISPSDIDDGQTHFEQIFTRALVALNNAATVFDHANDSTQLLRQQADSQASFERGVVDQEKDFNSRLIEIFGYPYPEDIGPGKTYPTGYEGPDIYHYMYSEETGIDRDRQLQSVYFNNPITPDPDNPDIPTIAESFLTSDPARPSEVNIGDGDDVTFTVNVNNYNLNGPFGTIGTDGNLPRQPVKVNYNMSFKNGAFGVHKPDGWGQRRAPGELQQAQAELFQAIASFMTSIDDYGSFVGNIEGKAAIVTAQIGLSADKLELLETRLGQKKTVQDVIFGLRITLGVLKTAADVAEAIAGWVAEAIPTVTGIIVGFSNGVIIDGLAPARGALGGAGIIISEVLKAASTALDLAELRLAQEGERKDDQLTIDTTELEGNFANLQAIKDLESELRNEVPFRIALHAKHQAVLQALGEYQKTLADGQRTLERRDLFRLQTAADVQLSRYKDMAFRIFRNDALQKYRAQYDLAARYVYLAAKAYDYETTMLSSDPRGGRRFLTDIVKARQLGTIIDGEPQTGEGLADSMAVMARNFEVLASQLGFNNPQVETNRFSLRTEFLRTLPEEEGDPVWRDVLARDFDTYGIGTVDNLWDVPEFRRYCVPPANFKSVEPGIVIPFSTTITEGENFFGAELGGFDSAYDSTQFATKIRSVGIWFTNYDFLNLSNTPRVYLIPVGNDILRSPTGFSGKTREFTVMDQVLPVPFPISVGDLEDPAWIPSIDTLSGELAAIRRFGRLRAYHDSGEFDESEVNRDSRLIGRSVWNTKWMLIIPGSTLSSDAEEGIRQFINGQLLDSSGPIDGARDGNGVSDVKLFFETYAYPRLKK